MNKKLVIYILFSFFLLSFTSPKHCKLSDRIFFKYNKEIQKQKGLHLVGKGGAMMYDIKEVIAHYVSFNKMTVEEVRELYVDIVEGLLSRYNHNETIRPYLHNYPFNIDNFSLMIGFEDEKRQHRSEGFVALVFRGRDQEIVYSAYDPETDKFIRLHREPYEEAREIVLGTCQKEEINGPSCIENQ